MQMVANGYGVTLVPQIAVDVEVRDERVKLLRFASPQPGRTIGLAWRRTSPRKSDFIALGQLVDRSARRRRCAAGAPIVRPRLRLERALVLEAIVAGEPAHDLALASSPAARG